MSPTSDGLIDVCRHNDLGAFLKHLDNDRPWRFQVARAAASFCPHPIPIVEWCSDNLKPVFDPFQLGFAAARSGRLETIKWLAQSISAVDRRPWATRMLRHAISSGDRDTVLWVVDQLHDIVALKALVGHLTDLCKTHHDGAYVGWLIDVCESRLGCDFSTSKTLQECLWNASGRGRLSTAQHLVAKMWALGQHAQVFVYFTHLNMRYEYRYVVRWAVALQSHPKFTVKRRGRLPGTPIGHWVSFVCRTNSGSRLSRARVKHVFLYAAVVRRAVADFLFAVLPHRVAFHRGAFLGAASSHQI